MEFKTKAHKQCYEKAKGYMKDLFGEQFVTIDERPVMILPHGSALLHVVIAPWGDDDATILMRAYVVKGPRVDEELMSYLLHKNDSMRFGAFGLDDDNDIFFEHTIVGLHCDKEEFKASALAVAGTADRLDDEIVQRWGGQKAADAVGSSPDTSTPSSTETVAPKDTGGFSVLRAIDEEEGAEKHQAGGAKKCPKCGTEYPPGTRWCEKDGCDLTDS